MPTFFEESGLEKGKGLGFLMDERGEEHERHEVIQWRIRVGMRFEGE